MVHGVDDDVCSVPDEPSYFSVPRQNIKCKQIGAKSRIILDGLVNIDEEVVRHDDNVTFGPRIDKAMRTYGRALRSVHQCDDRIALDMLILRLPPKLVLVRDKSAC